jgi:hypothetical protein
MERPSIHRVFEGGSPIKLSGPNVFQATDINSAYRLTGLPQIQDIIESGDVRAKAGKIKGGRIGEIHWSAGNPKLSYASSPTRESYVLQSQIQNVRGRQAGLPVSQARIWHSPIGTTEWKDITPQIQQQAGITKPVVAREAGRDLMPAARSLGRALGTEAASVGGMALRGAGRLAGPVGVAMTAYDLAQAFPAPAPISEEDMGQALREYRTGPQPRY